MSTELAALYPEHIGAVKRRFDAALAAAGREAVLVHAGAPHVQFLDDNPYPFKVNPLFKYWAPVTDNPDCFIHYRPGETPRLLFFRPVDFWHKPADPPEAFWTAHFDLRLVADRAAARRELPASLADCVFLGEWDPAFAAWGLRERNANPPTLLDHLHYHRAWKTAYEIACMREANRLAAAAHRAAEAAFRAGESEYAIHLAYLAACGHNEHQLPYGNIIALNEHAAVLHYQHQARRAPEARRSFLIDAGAQFHGYASDITRSHAAGDNAFAELIAAMEEVQQALCERVRPGLDYPELQTATHREVARLLAEFGILKGSADGAVENGLTRTFFPHGVGHYIGLQVHDVGGRQADERGTPLPPPEDQPFLRLTRRVEAGQVFTVEPGLYFIEPLLAELERSPLAAEVNWERIEHFRPFGGVRIEDDVAVTETGHENLTRAAFAALQ